MAEGKRKAFVSYLNDDNTTISTYVILTDLRDNYISFETKGNKITIPISRVLKIKEVQ